MLSNIIVYQLREAVGLLYKTTNELNRIIDSCLPPRPVFERHEIAVAGETFDLYSRDIVDCIKALWGDPEFLPYLVFEPERHYADDKHDIRMYHDMHTGNWWWSTQVCISGPLFLTCLSIFQL